MTQAIQTTKQNTKQATKLKNNNSSDYLNFIKVRGACENNLKNVDIDIPKNKFVVITGPSGSGKSSLAFDTIYMEGQRRYVESLSSNARYFMGIQKKPDVKSISGLAPAVAIDQKTTSRNPRSTVGTATEIYDFIRLLFARIGKVISPKTGKQLFRYSKQEIIALISLLPLDTKIRILAPVIKSKKGNFATELLHLKKQGYDKAKIDGTFFSLETIPELDGEKEHTIEIVIDRIIIKQNMGTRIFDAVEKCLKASESIVVLNIVALGQNQDKFTLNQNIEAHNGDDIVFSTQYVCPECNFKLESLEPKVFSFNNPFGACQHCHGLGTEVFFKEDLIVPDDNLSLIEGAIEPWVYDNPRYHNQIIIALSKKYDFSINTPYKELPENIRKILLYGTNEDTITIETEENLRHEKTSIIFRGVVGELQAKIQNCDEDPLVLDECEKYQTLTKCHYCNGYRLNDNVLCVKINNKNIGEISDMSISALTEWINELPNHLDNHDNEIAKPILTEIKNRLIFLTNVGLEYLSIGRSANTLSGGEAQRVRLSTQLGSGLCGVIYVLDEPSIGLHQCDNIKLINTIKDLRDLSNSVIVIEHDEETIKEADYIIDVGPGAGRYGGEIVAQGTPQEIMKNENSLTGLFLSGKMKIETPKARRRFGRGNQLELIGACENNLKNVNLKVPLGLFVAISGVSGGGKSTLILDTFYPAIAQQISRVKIKPGKFKEIKGLENIDKIIKIDQEPVGRSPKSNPATYTGVFTMIRDLFAAQPLSLSRGYKCSRFSCNVKGGRCENCQGDGVVKVEMHFLPDTYIKCNVCNGHRYNKETREVKYKGYSIDEILDLSVREALDVFKDELPIMEKLKALYNVGLDYVKLGQSATTLSGGEAQRIRLARELSRKATGNTLYILDEPTTGLHSCDIKQLLGVLHTLVDYGNSVVVIEHNLDVIKTADWVIDIGPKGGDLGGQIVAEGTPEQVADNPNSVTGSFLKKALN